MNDGTENRDTQTPETPSTLGAPEVAGSQDTQFSFEEIVLGDTSTGSATAPEQTHPDSAPETPEAPAQPDNAQTSEENDHTRYQYWQSQNDKAQAKLKQVENYLPTVEWLQNNPDVVNQINNGGLQSQPEAPVQEEFPSPPEEPIMPRGFSMQEAMDDPNSESGQYYASKEAYSTDLNNWTVMKSQYDNAVVNERLDAMDNQRRLETENARRAQAAREQSSNIHTHAVGHYGMNPEEAAAFVQWGNRPENLSMDNLVQLYRLQNGGNIQPTEAPQAPNGPSPDFVQTQRAQQVPSPMGVVSAQGGGNTTDPGTAFVNGLLDYVGKDTPF